MGKLQSTSTSPTKTTKRTTTMFSMTEFSRELEGRDESTSPFLQFNQTLLPVSQNAGNVVEEEELFRDLLDISSDMETFLAMNNIEEVKEEVTAPSSDILPNILHEVGIHEQPATTVMSGEETTQSLIDEVEHYLQTVSGESTKVDEEEDVMEMSVDVSASIERSWTLGGSPGPAPSSPAESNKPVIDAEKIFQALTTGNVFEQDQIDLDRAYTTSVVDKAGENVIIIIAPPPASTCPRLARLPQVLLPAAPRPAWTRLQITSGRRRHRRPPSLLRL